MSFLQKFFDSLTVDSLWTNCLTSKPKIYLVFYLLVYSHFELTTDYSTFFFVCLLERPFSHCQCWAASRPLDSCQPWPTLRPTSLETRPARSPSRTAGSLFETRSLATKPMTTANVYHQQKHPKLDMMVIIFLSFSKVSLSSKLSTIMQSDSETVLSSTHSNDWYSLLIILGTFRVMLNFWPTGVSWGLRMLQLLVCRVELVLRSCPAFSLVVMQESLLLAGCWKVSWELTGQGSLRVLGLLSVSSNSKLCSSSLSLTIELLWSL